RTKMVAFLLMFAGAAYLAYFLFGNASSRVPGPPGLSNGDPVQVSKPTAASKMEIPPSPSGQSPSTRGESPSRPEPTARAARATPKLAILHPEHDLEAVGPATKVSVAYENIPLSQHLW